MITNWLKCWKCTESTFVFHWPAPPPKRVCFYSWFNVANYGLPLRIYHAKCISYFDCFNVCDCSRHLILWILMRSQVWVEVKQWWAHPQRRCPLRWLLHPSVITHHWRQCTTHNTWGVCPYHPTTSNRCMHQCPLWALHILWLEWVPVQCPTQACHLVQQATITWLQARLPTTIWEQVHQETPWWEQVRRAIPTWEQVRRVIFIWVVCSNITNTTCTRWATRYWHVYFTGLHVQHA